MLHDIRITAAQLRAAGDWCEPALAEVELVLDYGVLVAKQGEEYAMWLSDGSDAPACDQCGRPEAAHEDQEAMPEPHEFTAIAGDCGMCGGRLHRVGVTTADVAGERGGPDVRKGLPVVGCEVCGAHWVQDPSGCRIPIPRRIKTAIVWTRFPDA